jgi:hypothetical protein
MTRDRITIKPCPDGIADHAVVHVDDHTADWLDLPRGSLMHLDRRRTPGNGDVVLAELDLAGRLTRTVRRYTRVEDVVSLARVDGQSKSLLRPSHEVGILGVADGHVRSLNQT